MTIRTIPPKKPKSRASAALLTALVFLLLFAGAGSCLWFNVGGIAETALPLLPQYKASMAALEKDRAGLTEEQGKLREQIDAIARSEKALAKREADVAAGEQKLKADQAALDGKLAQVRTAEESRQVTVGIYTALQPADAAKILDRASLAEAAAILKLLPADTVAAILTELDANKALELTKLIAR